ncbi:MAG: RNA-guided endonuclease TnpB family protein [Clostridiales bacterium]|nr:RNA-guided endonuclease TnpB family protein [Clostridiales bacterium]
MRTLTVKLYNSDDFGYLSDMINIAGIIYNTALTIIQDHYDATGELMDKYELQKQLRDLRNADENRHWRYVGSQAVQDITDRIYRAYRLFFSNKKKGVKCSPPRRRKVRKYKSVTYKQAGYKFLPDGRISINGYIYRYWDSYDGLLEWIEIKTVTIKRSILGEFFVYVTTDSPATMREARDGRGEVGMDFGLKTFLTLSDGSVIRSPEFFRQGVNEVRKASRALSRKVSGSNGYNRALRTLYRRHQDIANRRRDWFWKISHCLCSKYSVIAIEDLNINGMAKLWGRKVHDYAFSEFVEILDWCARKYGTRVIRIGRYYPSSQTCYACGHVWPGTKDLSVREWICPECGVTHDRDVNAAMNILAEAKRIINRMEQAKDA